MKGFQRSYKLFSLCGLNCGLCPMYIDKYCPGCGGGEGNQACAIARCSLQHGGIEYCFMCADYPCEKYDGIDEYDSFICHRNQLKDNERAKEIGLERYKSELEEKAEILNYLLSNCNSGRQKTLFCIAVNLLELQDIKAVLEQIKEAAEPGNLDLY